MILMRYWVSGDEFWIICFGIGSGGGLGIGFFSSFCLGGRRKEGGLGRLLVVEL